MDAPAAQTELRAALIDIAAARRHMQDAVRALTPDGGYIWSVAEAAEHKLAWMERNVEVLIRDLEQAADAAGVPEE